jgi:hypothetical protein
MILRKDYKIPGILLTVVCGCSWVIDPILHP